MTSNTANSTASARKTKLDKYDFNPQDNLQRRKKLQRLVKEGHLIKESIRIGTYTKNEEREEGPCAPSYIKYQQCLINNGFKLSKCLQVQREITRCENDNGLITQSVRNALNILETRKVNEWRALEMKVSKEDK